MKTPLSSGLTCRGFRLGAYFSTSVIAAVLLFASHSRAQTLYWDTNGATAGAATGGVANGTWDATATDWTTSSAGTIATSAYTSGATALFSAGTDTVTAAVSVSGTQTVGSRLELRQGAYTFNDGTIAFTGTELIRDASASSSVFNSAISIAPSASTSAQTFTIGKTVAGTLTINGNIGFNISGTPAASKTISFSTGNDAALIIFNGSVSNSPGGTATSGINIGSSSSASGTVQLNGDNSNLTASQSGGITRGTALLGHANGLGVGSINIGNSGTNATSTAGLLTNGAITVANVITLGNSAAGAQILIGGNTAQVSSFSGAINVTGETDNSLRFTAVSGGVVNFTNTISGTNAGADVVKQGEGTVVFSGANTYIRNTVVNAGTLLVNNTSGSGTGTGTVTVASGAKLGGSGTINGAVNVGGTLAPGNSPGNLTVNNNVTILDGGAVSMEIVGATMGTQYDRVTMTGASSVFSLNGTNNLVLTLSYTPAADALFFLLDNQGGSAIAGIFEQLNGVTTDLSQGALFMVGGQQFRISYTGDVTTSSFTGGNDLVLQAVVPEPATWLLLTASLASVIVFRRARKTC